MRAILRDFLSASEYTVIEAVDSAESVAKAASERPDLVLMDIQLPVLDGYQAVGLEPRVEIASGRFAFWKPDDGRYHTQSQPK